MKTLEELKKEMDAARADWEAADAARADWEAEAARYNAAADAWCDARVAYHKKLREVESEDT